MMGRQVAACKTPHTHVSGRKADPRQTVPKMCDRGPETRRVLRGNQRPQPRAERRVARHRRDGRDLDRDRDGLPRPPGRPRDGADSRRKSPPIRAMCAAEALSGHRSRTPIPSCNCCRTSAPSSTTTTATWSRRACSWTSPSTLRLDRGANGDAATRSRLAGSPASSSRSVCIPIEATRQPADFADIVERPCATRSCHAGRAHGNRG